MMQKTAIGTVLALGLCCTGSPGCGADRQPAPSPVPAASHASADAATAPEGAGAEDAGAQLTAEDKENMALSDCLGMCDMLFHCRPQISAAIGAKAAVALMGQDDDMEVCHGKCMDRIYDLAAACFDCYDLDRSCENMGACIKDNCAKR
jgi:hypothetical protein